MGNSSSGLHSDSTTFSPSISNISFDLDIPTLRNKLTELLEYHSGLLNAFDVAKSKISSYKIPIDSKENELDKFASSLPNVKKEYVMNLFKLGVLKVRVYSQSNTELYIQENNIFAKLQTKFIQNLKNLIESTTPLNPPFSLDTVDDSSVKSQYDSNVRALNDIVVRILLYKYNVLINNYVVNLYTIYIQSQIEVFEAQILKNKKQSEFTVVENSLKEILRASNSNVSNLGIDAHLQKVHSNMQKIQSGGNSIDVQIRNVERIAVLLKKYSTMYEESVIKTTKFFDLMSNMIEVKTNEIIEKYNKTSTNVFNNNIKNALTALETKVTKDQIRYVSQSDYMNFINESNLNDQDKSTLQQLLQIVSLENNASNFNQGLNDSLMEPMIGQMTEQMSV